MTGQDKAASLVPSGGSTVSPTDEWYAKWGDNRDIISIDVRMPGRVEMLVNPFGSNGLLFATLRIGGVSFVHEVEDMRLLLRSALEQLDLGIEYATTPDNTDSAVPS